MFRYALGVIPGEGLSVELPATSLIAYFEIQVYLEDM